MAEDDGGGSVCTCWPGNGTVEGRQGFPVGFYGSSIQIADLNADARPDIVAGDWNSGYLRGPSSTTARPTWGAGRSSTRPGPGHRLPPDGPRPGRPPGRRRRRQLDRPDTSDGQPEPAGACSRPWPGFNHRLRQRAHRPRGRGRGGYQDLGDRPLRDPHHLRNDWLPPSRPGPEPRVRLAVCLGPPTCNSLTWTPTATWTSARPGGGSGLDLSINQGNRNYVNRVIDLRANNIFYTWQLQTPDLNGDGLPEIIGTDYTTGRIFVLKSHQGTLAATFSLVADAVAPVLTVPAEQVAEAAGPDGASVHFPPATATDETDSNPRSLTPTCRAASSRSARRPCWSPPRTTAAPPTRRRSRSTYSSRTPQADPDGPGHRPSRPPAPAGRW